MMQRMIQAGGPLGRFLVWWVGEMKSCLDDVLAFVAPKWRRPLVLFADDSGLVLVNVDASGPAVLAQMPSPGFGLGLPDRIPESLTGLLDQGRRVRLIVSAKKSFICRLSLPLAAAPHLKTAVALQLPKLLPLELSKLHTDYVISRVNADSETVDIDVAALRRCDIEPIHSAIASWGLRIASMHLGDAADSLPRFRFAAGDVSPGDSRLHRLDRFLLATAATLGLACASVATTQSYRADRALAQAKADTTQPASLALVDHQRLLNKLEPLKELSELERMPSAGALLQELTARLPHDSWITTLEIKDRHIRIVGISPDSAALVKLLSGSDIFADVELHSSLSVGIGTGKDRFEITADSKDGLP